MDIQSMAMGQSFSQVDAFSDRPFSGNPAAVCILERAASDRWMQQVAAEMNLSETAFVVPQADGFGLRWFTPAVEVNLCGHATLASARMLWTDGYLDRDRQARFHTRSGVLTANLQGDDIALNFPAMTVTPTAPPPTLLKALGDVEIASINYDEHNFLVELAEAAQLRALAPDFTRMREVPGEGVIVTSLSDMDEYDFISRYFAPNVGIPEDPVTGMAHCYLAPYWQAKLSKPELLAYQASTRGGWMRVRSDGDRVTLLGQAVIVMRGELLHPVEFA
ncbi:MAG: PhzF family phenazine biosynthesis protein [Cyanobacteria bacterium P01_D01_bin.123]